MNIAISFDYELIWGVFENVSREYVMNNVAHSNNAAKRLFAINEKYSMPASWGVVGLALDGRYQANTKIDLLAKNTSKNLEKLYIFNSADDVFLDTICNVPKEFIKELNASNLQDLVSHTYFHSYSNTTTNEEIENDFSMFNDMLKHHKMPQVNCIIAPKNQVTDSFVKIAKINGYQKIRINPNNLLYSNSSWLLKFKGVLRGLRFLDSYLPINELFSIAQRNTQDNILVIGNFFIRPRASRILNMIHFTRFKIFYYYSKLKCTDISLWTHPHNFGDDLEIKLALYEKIVCFLYIKNKLGKVTLKPFKDL